MDFTIDIDPNGSLTFTEEQQRRWGLEPGTTVVVRRTPIGLILFPERPTARQSLRRTHFRL